MARLNRKSSSDLRKLAIVSLRDRLQRQLQKEFTPVSSYIEEHRVLSSGLYTFEDYPFLRAIHDSQAVKIVVMKAAQMGFTEWAINRTLYEMDVRAHDVLYMMPTDSEVSDFSPSRFDAAVNESPHFNQLFARTRNIGMKATTNGVILYIRGSRSRSKLKSIPVDMLVIDEFDETHRGDSENERMSWDSVPLALRRLSGSDYKRILLLSTPSLPGYGIAEEYEKTDQRKWFLRCPKCNELFAPDFPACVTLEEENPRIRCLLCSFVGEKRPFVQMGDWVITAPENSSPRLEGYHVSGICSPTLSLLELKEHWLDAQKSPKAEQELYNSDLAEPHAAEGIAVTDNLLDKATAHHRNGELKKSPMYMGVDIGNGRHHVEITHFDHNGIGWRALITEVSTWKEVDALMEQWDIQMCVVDAQPERSNAEDFCERWQGRALACFHVERKNSTMEIDWEKRYISCDKTVSLDKTLGALRDGKYRLPANTPHDYRRHFKACIRLTKPNKVTGKEHGFYQRRGADHYLLASSYCNWAYQVKGALAESSFCTYGGSFL